MRITVREMVEQLQRFDPEAEVYVHGVPVRDVGRRERDGLVMPTINLERYVPGASDQDGYDNLADFAYSEVHGH